MSNRPKRVAIYARVSTNDQNPEVQTAELKRFCSHREFVVVEEVVDHGFSGGTGSDRRPGLRRLKDLARRREVDLIVILKLDRLFRSLPQLLSLHAELTAIGVGLIAVRDHIDVTTPAGVLFFQMLGAITEFEKALIRERTLLGLEHARQSGKKLGRPRSVDEEKIRSLRQAGRTYSQIQKETGASSAAVARALHGTTTKSSK